LDIYVIILAIGGLAGMRTPDSWRFFYAGGGALLNNLDLALRHATNLPISIIYETADLCGARRRPCPQRDENPKNALIDMWSERLI
jgi:hypothetical protein